jgi:hypothetical protein
MSADIHLHIRTDEMTEKRLNAFGANGVLNKLHSGVDLDEKRELLDSSPSIFVAESGCKYTDQLINHFTGLTQITDEEIDFMRMLTDKHSLEEYRGRINSAEKVIEFLESNKGGEVFTVGY